ncbi:MAG TPA: DUF4974 domain-containing protein, partial [Saprospiraceae bacterium]|nr:DUF4974 domain-containing protein [Saprospiraceae bacterium]
MKYFIYKLMRITMIFVFFGLMGGQKLIAEPSVKSYFISEKDTEKDMIDVLNQLSEYYQVFFTYDTELLKNVKVTFEMKRGESFDQAIKRLMKETGLDYNIYNDKYLVIFKNDKKGKKAAKKLGKMINEIQKIESEGQLSIKYNSSIPEHKLAN